MNVNHFVTAIDSLLFKRATGGCCSLNSVYNAFVLLNKIQRKDKENASKEAGPHILEILEKRKAYLVPSYATFNYRNSYSSPKG